MVNGHDRPNVESMEIEGGQITLVESFHSPTDSTARPTRLVVLEYTLIDGELEQTGMIDLPEPAEDLSGEED
jgi:hypothetical protein